MTNNSRESRSEKIGVFLIDRNKFFRQGVRSALEKHTEIEILGECDADAETIDLIQAVSPQIAIVDVNPPLLSGIELIRQIAQHLPSTAIVALTPYFNDDELAKATIAGATAYLSKDIEAAELINIIRNIADGKLLLVESLLSKPLVLERVLRHFQDLLLRGRASESINGPLTDRETEVLSYVACGYGNKQIAHALGISEQTIKNHMTAIMAKLEASDRTHAVVMAMQNGWISTSAQTKNGIMNGR
ncbi:MAG: response regulator transcription factor [Dehalococcoidia bacterium]